eukprot:1150977-Pelagomonas_calceolata.AAC.1
MHKWSGCHEQKLHFSCVHLVHTDLPPERVAEDGEPEPESSDSDREEGGNCKQKKKKKVRG